MDSESSARDELLKQAPLKAVSVDFARDALRNDDELPARAVRGKDVKLLGQAKKRENTKLSTINKSHTSENKSRRERPRTNVVSIMQE